MNNNCSSNRPPVIVTMLQDLLGKLDRLARPASEVILDDVDLRELLKVSKRTTATWRSQGLIKHSWLNGKCYYRYSDVLDAIERNAVTPISSQLKIKL